MKIFLLSVLATLFLWSWEATAQDPDEDTSASDEPVSEERERRGVRRLGDVVGEGGEEWSMDIPTVEMPPEPVEAQPEVNLPDPEQDAQLQSLLTRRAFVPQDPDIQVALDALMDEVEVDAAAALEAGDVELAQQLVSVIAEFSPDREIVEEVRAEITRRSTVNETLAEADSALAAGQLIAPSGQNARDLYQQVLALEPGNSAAQQGLESVHEAVIERALEEARDLEFEEAQGLLARASEMLDRPDAVDEARSTLASIRDSHISDLDSEVVAHIDSGDFDQAEEGITQLVALGHDRERIESLEDSLADARLYGSFEPGQTFSDDLAGVSESAPTMVVVPAGSFMMGSPENEDDRFSNEGPRHRVNIERGFAMSQTEVTVGDFAVFVDETRYVTDAEREGGSRVYDPNSGRMDSASGITWRDDYTGETADPDLPVIHVSYNDAQAYTEWLSSQTDRNYRLPSEAEYEYALRAGSQTPYWWGEGSPDEVVENLTGDGDSSPTNARWNVAFRRYNDGYWGPAPVGSFEPNPFGLYDMGGNVMSWTEDCWHDSFVRAPSDGSAWVNPGCERRVIKGASWSSTPAMARSAFRLSSRNASTDMRVGFRVARDL